MLLTSILKYLPYFFAFHDKNILLIYYRSSQFVCKLKNHHTDIPNFPDFPQIQLWENSVSKCRILELRFIVTKSITNFSNKK